MHILIGVAIVFLLVAAIFGFESAQSVFKWLIGLVFVGIGILLWKLGDRPGDAYNGYMVFGGYGCFFLAYLVIKKRTDQ
jgi:hypothetical protein